jgi:ADP-ribose pyrophosphatase YjhB (NUDIX family)
MKRDFAIYQVGLKILLRRGRKVLFLRAAYKKCFDEPGGRIDTVEHRMPLEKVLAREVREELGNVRYTLGGPLFQFRRYIRKKRMWVFLTVYDACFVSGTITLSGEHSSYEWIDPTVFRFSRKDFANNEEYVAMASYFKKTYGRKKRKI